MNALYQKNVNALKAFQPQFDIPEIKREDAEIVTGTDGLLNIKLSHNGRPFHIHGTDSVLETAGARTGDIFVPEGSVIAAFGLGLGYEAREIIKKLGRGASLIIAEPDCGILPLTLEQADLTDIIEAPNVHFYSVGDKSHARVFFQKFISASNYKNMSAFVLKPYADMFFTEMRDLLFALDEIRAEFETSEATGRYFAQIWQQNALLNMRHNIESLLVSDFFDKFKNIPAVIVSAGPSLTKNIAGLKGLEDKCVIISVDTALKPLLANGITPHFAVSMDGQEIVADKFRDIEYSHIPLIYIPVSCNLVLEGHSGIKLVSPAQDAFFQRLIMGFAKDATALEMGGSVATGAFSFAWRTGCNPIILIGQDLAYTDGKTHADGAAFAQSVDISGRSDIFTLPSQDGGVVATDNIFRTYITWFEARAAHASQDNRVYIDATEGGVKLRGFKDMRLKEAADIYMNKTGVSEQVKTALNEAPGFSINQKKQMSGQYKNAVSFLESISAPAKTTAQRLDRISALLSKKKPAYKEVNSIYAKTSVFEDRIKGNADKLQLIGFALSPEAERLNAEFDGADFKTDLEMKKFAAAKYSEYYRKIAKIIEELNDTFKKSFTNLY